MSWLASLISSQQASLTWALYLLVLGLIGPLWLWYNSRHEPLQEQDRQRQVREQQQEESRRRLREDQLKLPTAVKPGQLCINCHRFFSKKPIISPDVITKESDRKINLQSRKVWMVQQNAVHGCPFCALISLRLRDTSALADDSLEFVVNNYNLSEPQSWTIHASFGRGANQSFIDFVVTPYNKYMISAIKQDEGPIQRTNNSPHSMQLARRWHFDCKKAHEKCCIQKSPTGRNWRPTRLLEFSDSEQDGKHSVRLVYGADLPGATEYVVLSHCWGKIHLMKLLESTEVELRARIPLSRLPKTFREAISVSRCLNYNYIWIDSLCIVQDSAEDWQRESQTMKLVYSRGAITIAAAHAHDSSKGLFVERNPHSIRPPIVRCKWFESSLAQPCCIVDMRHGTSGVSLSVLAGRAWTVQERTLSSRLLTFGHSQMFYHCLEGECSESWPRSAAPYSLDVMKMKQLRGANDSPSEAWRSIVSTYSCAALTKAEDKIIALAGIAEAMQEKLADQYVVGLWKRNLLTELLWTVGQGARPRPSPCIAPTWSWLSTSGGATVTTIEGTAKEHRAVSTVVNVSVDLVDPNYPTGNIFPGALLQLRGRLKAATWNLVPGYGATDFRKYQVTGDGLRNSEESRDSNSRFFTEVDISPGLDLTFLKIFLLPIAIFDGTRGSTVRGLILTPTMEEADIYERVAHFTFTGERASYLFVERSSESQQGMSSRDMSGAEVLDADGLVEGFPFDGGMEWVRIKEKDIIIV